MKILANRTNEFKCTVYLNNDVVQIHSDGYVELISGGDLLDVDERNNLPNLPVEYFNPVECIDVLDAFGYFNGLPSKRYRVSGEVNVVYEIGKYGVKAIPSASNARNIKVVPYR